MTRREKVLALCVGGALGGMALVSVVKWTVIEPFRSVDKRIEKEREHQDKLQKELRSLRTVEKQWQDWTRRTLSGDPYQARRQFRKDLDELLSLHGLEKPEVRDSVPKTDRNGLVSVAVSIDTRGTLKEIVGFLCDFYRPDYLGRLDKVHVSAEQRIINDINTPRGSRGGSKKKTPSRTARSSYGADGPELDLDMTAVTLVLPKLKDIEHPVMEEIDRQGDGRLRRERVAYNKIVDWNLLRPYEEKKAVVVKPVKPTNPVKPVDTKRTTPVVKVDPRKDADKQFLIGTTLLNGEHIAYILDERKRDQPPEQFGLDEPIDDGVLLLIHPRGLVIRVEEPNGREKDYFYRLGRSFKEREALDPAVHPEIAAALKEEFLP